MQAVLGILTLLHQVPVALGLAHQAGAIMVLTLAILQAERLAAPQVDPTRQKLGLPVRQAG
jgi:cytochrome c oxidase assembly protein subunit 15